MDDVIFLWESKTNTNREESLLSDYCLSDTFGYCRQDFVTSLSFKAVLASLLHLQCHSILS